MSPEICNLSNGFQLITCNMPYVESVMIQIWVKVGSRFELENKIGISHFFEHMAFKGTDSRTAFDIAKSFDDIGGVLNAYTDRECTVYYAKVPKKDINIALQILADIIINSNFPNEEIEREKSVVIQEIYQTNDSPSNIIFDKYMEIAYRDQPFGRSILGSIDIVKNFTRTDITEFMKQYYGSNNMFMVITGNVKHDEVSSIVSSYFSKVNRASSSIPQSAKYIGGEYLEERDLDQVNLILGFPGISFEDEKYYSIQVLDSILGGGMSSRLFQEIRERLGLAYSISSFNSSYSDTGTFSICASTSEDNLLKLLKAIAIEIKKLENDLTEEEIARTKMKIESEILMSGESTYSCATFLGCNYLRYGRFVSKQELLDHFSKVKIADVKDCIGSLLSNDSKITIAAIGKLNTMPRYEEVINMLK